MKCAIGKAQMILYNQCQEQGKTCSNLGQKGHERQGVEGPAYQNTIGILEHE